MIHLGQSTDGLWRVGRNGAVLHTCRPGEGLGEATAAAVKLRTPGEQLRRQFWRVTSAKPPADIGRVLEVGTPASAVIDAAAAAGEAITELLSGTVVAIDKAITAGEWDDDLAWIADIEAACKGRKGVRLAVESRQDDLDL